MKKILWNRLQNFTFGVPGHQKVWKLQQYEEKIFSRLGARAKDPPAILCHGLEGDSLSGVVTLFHEFCKSVKNFCQKEGRRILKKCFLPSIFYKRPLMKYICLNEIETIHAMSSCTVLIRNVFVAFIVELFPHNSVIIQG